MGRAASITIEGVLLFTTARSTYQLEEQCEKLMEKRPDILLLFGCDVEEGLSSSSSGNC